MTTTYSLTRTFDDDDSPYASASFTTGNVDHINCAHMIAAGFNTMSRNFMGDFVLGVVNTTAGTVEYDGKIEQIKRDEPWSFSSTMHFTADPEGDHIVTLFDNENGRLTYPSKFKFAGTDEPEPSAFAHVARDVLEDAYDEYLLVRAMLSEIGIETTPISAGVDELREQVAELTKRNNHEFHARSLYEQAEGQKREAARAELIEHVKRAYVKWGEVDPGRQREGLKSHLRGMIEVLSKYLVAMGEADADERHAVALRVCEIPEGNYLYDDA